MLPEGMHIALLKCIMGFVPAWGNAMGRFAAPHPERGVLLRHEPSPFARPGEVSIRRAEALDPPASHWQQDIERIRDRVTISAWSSPGTTVRHETYNRNGSLSSTVHLPLSTGSSAGVIAVRCEATVVMAKSPGAAWPSAGKEEPARAFYWSPAKALPGPA